VDTVTPVLEAAADPAAPVRPAPPVGPAPLPIPPFGCALSFGGFPVALAMPFPPLSSHLPRPAAPLQEFDEEPEDGAAGVNTEKVSAYEMERAANIARNKEKLRDLGLGTPPVPPKRAKEKKDGGEAAGVEQAVASKRPRREAPTIRSEPVRDLHVY
jgi:hypothetical protein